jgi:hypothetical protein
MFAEMSAPETQPEPSGAWTPPATASPAGGFGQDHTTAAPGVDDAGFAAVQKVWTAADTASKLLALAGYAAPLPLNVIGMTQDAYNVGTGVSTLATQGLDDTPAEVYGDALLSAIKLPANFLPGGNAIQGGIGITEMVTQQALGMGLNEAVGGLAKGAATHTRDAVLQPDLAALALYLDAQEGDPALLPQAPPPVQGALPEGGWPTPQPPDPHLGPVVSTTLAGGGVDQSWASGYAT